MKTFLKWLKGEEDDRTFRYVCEMTDDEIRECLFMLTGYFFCYYEDVTKIKRFKRPGQGYVKAYFKDYELKDLTIFIHDTGSVVMHFPKIWDSGNHEFFIVDMFKHLEGFNIQFNKTP